ncbi:hypothetical protein IKF15_02655 [Candidatus Saccharibacteria bacterium]|nr:hypothetical protein [Candidatus Saccharibacteria bacterium]
MYSHLPLDTLYIDLNSCFATVEQQARPMLRGRPIAVTNRLAGNACIVAASYEAKAHGVKVGMRRYEAEALCPSLIFTETDPDKYTFVYRQLRKILSSYSPDIAMKSIDEGTINLAASPPHLRQLDHAELVSELKTRLKTEIGCYMRCNVGISSNCFLAKLAAELHKPDGYDEITPDNQRQIFQTLSLRDLPGINYRLEARLNAVNIFTPLEFLDADEATLTKLVFKSIDGKKWFQRLRGLEVDAISNQIHSIGRQYVLESRNLPRDKIEAHIIHLAEDVGQRLRRKHLYARGVYLWLGDLDGTPVHRSILLKSPIHTDADIIHVARQLYSRLPSTARIVGITLYKLQPTPERQLHLNQPQINRSHRLCQATDAINRRFGYRTIFNADSFGTSQVKVKIPFGSTRFL